MGCDGGTIPKRDELVRQKKKAEQKDKNSELSFRWRHCALSQEPLRKPIVACGLGRLYNKEALIEHLINKSEKPEVSHIKNLKDVKDLTLTPNPEYSVSPEKGDSYVNSQAAPYICPIMGLEMNGHFKFVFLWTCGCVFSERSLKSVKATQCLKCQKPFEKMDVVIINPNEDEITTMHDNLEIRVKKLKELKKAKKLAKTVEIKTETSIETNPQTTISQNSNSNNSIKTTNLKRTNPESSIPKDLKMHDPAMKKMKKDYSIAKDPKSSEVYKSLFTSHSNAQQQTRAHWVTYNPFYN